MSVEKVSMTSQQSTIYACESPQPHTHTRTHGTISLMCPFAPFQQLAWCDAHNECLEHGYSFMLLSLYQVGISVPGGYWPGR